jgi:hypothetical protein
LVFDVVDSFFNIAMQAVLSSCTGLVKALQLLKIIVSHFGWTRFAEGGIYQCRAGFDRRLSL